MKAVRANNMFQQKAVWLVCAAVSAIACMQLCAAETAKDSSDNGIDWAKEQQFWSFHSPTMPTRPEVKNKRWPRRDLDYFILTRLEQKALTPSTEAEKRTLIRRVTFDLTGLPPTPDEIESFLKDKRASAYEHLVERLL